MVSLKSNTHPTTARHSAGSIPRLKHTAILEREMPVTISPGVLAVVKDQSQTPTGMRVPFPDTVHGFRVAYDRCFRISRYVPMLQIRACFRGKGSRAGLASGL